MADLCDSDKLLANLTSEEDILLLDDNCDQLYDNTEYIDESMLLSDTTEQILPSDILSKAMMASFIVATDTPAVMDTPTVATDTPSVTMDTPSVTMDTPTVATDTLPVATDTLTVTTDTLPVATDTLTVTTDTLTVATDTPTVTTDTLTVATDTLPVATDTPTVAMDTPTVAMDTPTVATGNINEIFDDDQTLNDVVNKSCYNEGDSEIICMEVSPISINLEIETSNVNKLSPEWDQSEAPPTRNYDLEIPNIKTEIPSTEETSPVNKRTPPTNESEKETPPIDEPINKTIPNDGSMVKTPSIDEDINTFNMINALPFEDTIFSDEHLVKTEAVCTQDINKEHTQLSDSKRKTYTGKY